MYRVVCSQPRSFPASAILHTMSVLVYLDENRSHLAGRAPRVRYGKRDFIGKLSWLIFKEGDLRQPYGLATSSQEEIQLELQMSNWERRNGILAALFSSQQHCFFAPRGQFLRYQLGNIRSHRQVSCFAVHFLLTAWARPICPILQIRNFRSHRQLFETKKLTSESTSICLWAHKVTH